MRKKTERESRESALASGWRVEAEPNATVDGPAQAGLSGSTHPDDSATRVSVLSEGEDGSSPDTALTQDPGTSPSISNGALVVLGVFGGLYLLYSWGWFIIAQAYAEMNAYAAAGSGSVGSALQQIVFWAAPLAPALWFFVSLVVSRGGRTKRLAWSLFLGAIVLVPLPMLIAQGG